MNLSAQRPCCFLCRATAPEIYQTLTSEEIRVVWRLVELELDDEIFDNPAVLGDVHLYRCRKCGFQFFDPALAGNDRFYRELQDLVPGYYSPTRPENDRNARFAREHGFRSILDIGCGTGFALDAAREQGLQTYGVELNPNAAAETRARGHTVFSVLVHELDSQWNGQFDMISLNQVLEHVPDPVALVKDCLRLLSARGVIAIAVPGSTGVLRWHPWGAFNWPPHHLSRWRRKDFFTLAERHQLTVERVGGDQLFGGALHDILLANYRNCLALGKPVSGLNPALIRWISFCYRKAGLKYLFRGQGHSIFCFLSLSTGAKRR
jgi:SAM-dependent methyltransferase